MDESNPVPIEYTFPHELLELFIERGIHPRSLRYDLGHQRAPLLLIHRLLKEHLGRLGEYEPDTSLLKSVLGAYKKFSLV